MRKHSILILSILASLVMNRSGAQDPVISAEQNYAASSPGVVMVQTVYTGIVYVNKVEMNERRFQLLVRAGYLPGVDAVYRWTFE